MHFGFGSTLGVFYIVSGLLVQASALPGDWTGPYAPCYRHSELLSQGHMNLGVRFSTSDAGLAREFARAFDFLGRSPRYAMA